MINKFRILAILFFLISTLIYIPYPILALDNNNQDLIALSKKVSNNFASKFCNGIGFGLSRDSAFTFALVVVYVVYVVYSVVYVVYCFR